jgi:hypothetical protein
LFFRCKTDRQPKICAVSKAGEDQALPVSIRNTTNFFSHDDLSIVTSYINRASSSGTPSPPMKGATDYEDQGDLKNPVNQVIG